MSVSSFIPQIWNARLLYNLEKAHVAANIVNRNYEGDIRSAGDQVKINTIGPITIKDYTANTDMAAADDLTTTAQTLTIDQSKYFHFQVDDIDRVQAVGDLVDTAMARASYGLADASDAFLLKTMATGGTASGTAAFTAANAYEQMVSIRVALDKANVPTTGRWVVVPPEVYGLLLQDARFTVAQATAGAVLLNGQVGSVVGMTVYVSNNLYNDGTNTHIVAGIADGCTYAEQIIETEAYRPELRFADAVKGLHVYGAKVTDAAKIAVVKATF